jgi:hypothetical protein
MDKKEASKFLGVSEKTINRYGMEHREQIRQILETIDFEQFNEAELWQTLEKMIVSSKNV